MALQLRCFSGHLSSRSWGVRGSERAHVACAWRAFAAGRVQPQLMLRPKTDSTSLSGLLARRVPKQHAAVLWRYVRPPRHVRIGGEWRTPRGAPRRWPQASASSPSAPPWAQGARVAITGGDDPVVCCSAALVDGAKSCALNAVRGSPPGEEVIKVVRQPRVLLKAHALCCGWSCLFSRPTLLVRFPACPVRPLTTCTSTTLAPSRLRACVSPIHTRARAADMPVGSEPGSSILVQVKITRAVGGPNGGKVHRAAQHELSPVLDAGGGRRKVQLQHQVPVRLHARIPVPELPQLCPRDASLRSRSCEVCYGEFPAPGGWEVKMPGTQKRQHFLRRRSTEQNAIPPTHSVHQKRK